MAGHRQQTIELSSLTVFQAGQRAKSQIFGGLRTGWFILTITAALTVSGGVLTTVQNNGSLLSLFSYLGVMDNNDDSCYWDARMLGALTDCVAPRNTNNVRLNSLAAATYNLSETVMIPYAWPLSGNAWETSFVERNHGNSPSYVFAIPQAGYNPANAAGLSQLLTTANAASLANLQITIEQVADDQASIYPPIYRPKFEMVTQPVTGAVSGLRVSLDTARPQRALLVQQDTNVGTVNDIITGYRLMSDLVDVDAPNVVNYAARAKAQALETGGNVFQYGGTGIAPAGGCYLFRNLQLGGRLTTIVDPRTIGKNWRMEVTGQPSVAAGATTSNVNIGLITMEKIDGVTVDVNLAARAQPVASAA